MKKHIFAITAIAVLSVGAAGQASASSIHTVQSGDTLWSISQANNVSVEELQTWNELDSTLIYPSQNLEIEDKVDTYVVAKGDTLLSIANKNGISVSELMKWNNSSSDLIHPGDQLVLQGSKVVSKPATTNPVAKEMTVTATAYTANCEGCSGVTSTGIDLLSNPNQKVIAVDPAVIQLGSRVWVEGYGEAIAGDIGSAIKGNIIDVFVPDEQDALEWGRKTVNIKILN
ncbi:LysM peptidoglycan-binding domain-containing protein [Sporosarcina sp. BP05]|uniref:LysM peptidoglycan-binding domain-containing protein n=1 Tax=Sporosarcina sp. BP05 TaxID=2758726 RepID=UPI0016473838|nr:3D domain-containing protein [Sporosarcina sp. BP05]